MSGHQRCRVAKALGWEEIDAVVVDDLSESEIELRLVHANLNRRQLDPHRESPSHLGNLPNRAEK